MANRLSKAYLLTKVLTANSGEVITYLYEGAGNYLGRAVNALKSGDRAEAGVAIDRAVGILIELSENLDYAQGGQLALRLNSIYNHIIESLTIASGQGDVDAVESCRGIVGILHDAWRQALESLDSTSVPAFDAGLQISA